MILCLFFMISFFLSYPNLNSLSSQSFQSLSGTGDVLIKD